MSAKRERLGATFSLVDAIIYQRSSAPSTPVAVNWLLLQKAGLRENGQSADTSCYEKVSDDDEDDMSDMNSLSKKSDSTSVHKYVTTERKKSLGLLTQNFVKLFLCTDMDMISLDDAAKLLLGDGKHTSMTTRTKVRRLYDIANVLSSMKFIEKRVAGTAVVFDDFGIRKCSKMEWGTDSHGGGLSVATPTTAG
ncbi:E2F/DP winged-helix DNA-binding domain [Castilleja foliolosa]|uniref:E2F/DP winged-helix DNA-binding domain n=1 Tax=Castilleja foliolosa TaxID=1961234 RepID=A0ABD3DE16_9LAMI